MSPRRRKMTSHHQPALTFVHLLSLCLCLLSSWSRPCEATDNFNLYSQGNKDSVDTIDKAVDVARAAFGFGPLTPGEAGDRKFEVTGGRANSGETGLPHLFGSVQEEEEEKQITFPKAFATQADLRSNILNGIVEYGVNQTSFLYNIEEPRLFRRGLNLGRKDPGMYLAAFNKQKVEAKELAKYGYIALHAASRLSQQLMLTRTQATYELSRIPLKNTRLFSDCPIKSDSFRQTRCRATSAVFRTSDATCNNPINVNWGASMRPFLRFLAPEYSDGIQEPRRSVTGDPLPNPRVLSSLIHRSLNAPSSKFSLMLMQWGQFLDHDITSTAQTRGFENSVPKCCNGETKEPLFTHERHPDCMPIVIPSNDTFYGSFKSRCMEFVRSSPAPRADCPLGPREQINQITSFLDGSNVYGSNDLQQRHLRLFKHGMLKYTPLFRRKSLLPPLDEQSTSECRQLDPSKHCFQAGDDRVNEQPGLAILHTLWVREHNRIAEILSDLNRHWDDERVFQEARKIVGAMMQHITFNEFLPVVLGPRVLELFNLKLQPSGYYEGYNISINPTVANAFGTAAFRFGHSLVQPKLKRCDKFHRIIPGDVDLHKEMMDPSPLHGSGAVDRLALGLAAQEAQNRDEFVTDQLTNHLFQAPDGDFGMDLVAINIQRGRDHGLPPYNVWRERCSLKRVRNFSDLLDVMHDDTVGRLRMAYADVRDIDLFTGGLSERPIVGGLVGPTFACILAQQFMNLRRGDRFWYENGGFRSSFTPAQLQQIRRSSLSRVMCDNLDDVDTLQLRIMEMANVEGNVRYPCRSNNIPTLDFIPWRELSRPSFYRPPSNAPSNDDFGDGPQLAAVNLNNRNDANFFKAFERRSNPASNNPSLDALPQPFGVGKYEDPENRKESSWSLLTPSSTSTSTANVNNANANANVNYNVSDTTRLDREKEFAVKSISSDPRKAEQLIKEIFETHKSSLTDADHNKLGNIKLDFDAKN